MNKTIDPNFRDFGKRESFAILKMFSEVMGGASVAYVAKDPAGIEEKLASFARHHFPLMRFEYTKDTKTGTVSIKFIKSLRAVICFDARMFKVFLSDKKIKIKKKTGGMVVDIYGNEFRLIRRYVESRGIRFDSVSVVYVDYRARAIKCDGEEQKVFEEIKRDIIMRTPKSK